MISFSFSNESIEMLSKKLKTQKMSAKVLSFEGKVKVLRNGIKKTKSFRATSIPDEIVKETLISTGKNSRLHLLLPAKEELYIGPSSVVLIKLLANSGPSLIELKSGNLRLAIDEKTDGVNVFTSLGSVNTSLGEVLIFSAQKIYFMTALSLRGSSEVSAITHSNIRKIGPGLFSFVARRKGVVVEPTLPQKLSKNQFRILRRKTAKGRSVSSFYSERSSLWRVSSSGYSGVQGMAPPAGGFIDLKSGIYIPPFHSYIYKKEDDEYRLNRKMGTLDKETGNYLPPEKFYLKFKKNEVFLQSKSRKNLLIKIPFFDNIITR